jgi:hypothetical protein
MAPISAAIRILLEPSSTSLRSRVGFVTCDSYLVPKPVTPEVFLDADSRSLVRLNSPKFHLNIAVRYESIPARPGRGNGGSRKV